MTTTTATTALSSIFKLAVIHVLQFDACVLVWLTCPMFLAAMLTARFEVDEAVLLETLRRFDKDNRGYLTLQTFQHVLGDDITMEEVKHAFCLVDGNHVGKKITPLASASLQTTRLQSCPTTIMELFLDPGLHIIAYISFC